MKKLVTFVCVFLSRVLFAQSFEAPPPGAYPLDAVIWPSNTIPVCWEDFNNSVQLRALVQSAVEREWEGNSQVDFTGWGLCNANSEGIRILVNDEGPHVKILGRILNGWEEGMVLNFDYVNWGSACQSMINFCTEAIAGHEFGHALGFAHEQNRPDTPPDCLEPQQGGDGNVLFTEWDLDSVMNYCNPI